MSAREYRTPEETRAWQQQTATVQKVLDQAIQDGTSLIVAIKLGEPPAVVEQWINRLWNGLAKNLNDKRRGPDGLLIEDRLTAIVLLLEQRINDQADTVLRSIRDVTP